jgi:hypothetical protein
MMLLKAYPAKFDGSTIKLSRTGAAFFLSHDKKERNDLLSYANSTEKIRAERNSSSNAAQFYVIAWRKADRPLGQIAKYQIPDRWAFH